MMSFEKLKQLFFKSIEWIEEASSHIIKKMDNNALVVVPMMTGNFMIVKV